MSGYSSSAGSKEPSFVVARLPWSNDEFNKFVDVKSFEKMTTLQVSEKNKEILAQLKPLVYQYSYIKKTYGDLEEEDVPFTVTYFFKIGTDDNKKDKFLQNTSENYTRDITVTDMVDDAIYLINKKKRGTIPKTADIKLFVSRPNPDYDEKDKKSKKDYLVEITKLHGKSGINGDKFKAIGLKLVQDDNIFIEFVSEKATK